MSAAALATRVAWLADDTDVGDETHKAGPIAILVIVVLCVTCFFLFRSMSKHLRRVRDDFPDPSGPPAGDTTATSTAATTTASDPAAATDPAAAPAVHTAATTRAAPKSKTRPGPAGDTRTR